MFYYTKEYHTSQNQNWASGVVVSVWSVGARDHGFEPHEKDKNQSVVWW
jgi:hypothetical protein